MRQRARPLVILGEPVHVVLQRVDPRRRHDAGLPHRAAEPLLEHPGLLDEVARPRQHGADRCAQPLGEIEPDGIERCARKCAAEVPLATTALSSRAPSMWHAQPRRMGRRTDLLDLCTGQQTPPAILAVCSSESAAGRGM